MRTGAPIQRIARVCVAGGVSRRVVASVLFVAHFDQAGAELRHVTQERMTTNASVQFRCPGESSSFLEVRNASELRHPQC